jgi:hypothetical protein
VEMSKWTDRVRSEVLEGVRKETNIQQTITRKKANWIGHILRRSYVVNYVIEGKIEGRIESR